MEDKKKSNPLLAPIAFVIGIYVNLATFIDVKIQELLSTIFGTPVDFPDALSFILAFVICVGVVVFLAGVIVAIVGMIKNSHSKQFDEVSQYYDCATDSEAEGYMYMEKNGVYKLEDEYLEQAGFDLSQIRKVRYRMGHPLYV